MTEDVEGEEEEPEAVWERVVVRMGDGEGVPRETGEEVIPKMRDGT